MTSAALEILLAPIQMFVQANAFAAANRIVMNKLWMKNCSGRLDSAEFTELYPTRFLRSQEFGYPWKKNSSNTKAIFLLTMNRGLTTLTTQRWKKDKGPESIQ